MSKKFICVLTVLSAIFVIGTPVLADAPAATKSEATQAPAKEPKAPITKEELSKISEAFGNFIGRNLKTTGIDFDIDAIVKGIRDGSTGKPSPLTDAEYEQKMIALQEQAFQKQSESNLKKAEDFLSNNAKASGVKEIEPGKLQILVIKEGTGPAVTESSTPMINYIGKYADGTVFGNSEDAGGPITIPLDQTIPGFSKGLIGMKEGEKRRIFVHPDLGYGTTGHLAPNSLLIFDVEVVKSQAPTDSGDGEKHKLSLNDLTHEDDLADEDMEDEEESDAAKTTTKTAKPSAPSTK